MADLHILPTTRANAKEDTIWLLEDFLERAKNGEIIEIAMVGFLDSGDQTFVMSPMVDTLKKIGILAQLQFDLMQARTR